MDRKFILRHSMEMHNDMLWLSFHRLFLAPDGKKRENHGGPSTSSPKYKDRPLLNNSSLTFPFLFRIERIIFGFMMRLLL